MARRGKKKGRPISGWLILDKPVGMGSTEAVSKIKWLFQAEKAGHAGTLDPLASGMLPIALGEATKTVPYVQDGAKIYRFTVAWGQERSTDDLEGPVAKESDLRPSEAEVLALLPKYTGVIMQTPPQFSAIKIAGERAYDLARDGATVDIPAREIEIGRLDVVEHGADHTVFEVECGKGTYVRSLARDMGRDMGCFGHISELRRVEVEPFTSEDFVTIAELEAARFGVVEGNADATDIADATVAADTAEAADKVEVPIDFDAIDALLVDTSAALDCLPQIAISDDAATKIRLGNPVIIRGRDAPVEAEEACATARGKLVAIGAIEQGMFKPKRVFAG
ncbi:tRNA pseudouridine(55) synthase TruB [Mesorhizobium sp. M7A.F.Ca.MR.362.00.0.0]|uniref:tRNA pseudouridine(55) synthase TruB n=1 Tax=Mesorhizobium sp. M7A.F.Ca.MR.362.00.0.0 TaxID=2496779 RepID=UPI000FD1C9FD|nr:tRNA pseudouridine(55) synthase TruB [Mesorhizobium sp. M7A.F.Ca.MR.362.00.0.0]RUU82964.1 tRNA pseudouridine(55) synthase TruB [Mesorhizobium sp. M7A.F.Ca.MR.362.00.0.0]RWN96703.1 MAG: tRNA pseudouridine(55) synthase TruB [Mesorhizobium sp.]